MDSEPVFIERAGRLAPTVHARGPWDPSALHGGAPAALLTGELERVQPGAELALARLSFEFIRPVPMAPLDVSVRVTRPGRRVQGLEAELLHDGRVVCRAAALRVQPVPEDAAALVDDPDELGGSEGPGPMPGPERGAPAVFTLDGDREASFAATGMEMRWITDPEQPGPARVWMRLQRPLLPGRDATPLMSLVAAADFANGVSAVLPFGDFLFINADLVICLNRRPRGEWIGLDASTHLPAGGCGRTETVLHDEDGPVGRGLQTLVVQRR